MTNELEPFDNSVYMNTMNHYKLNDCLYCYVNKDNEIKECKNKEDYENMKNNISIYIITDVIDNKYNKIRIVSGNFRYFKDIVINKDDIYKEINKVLKQESITFSKYTKKYDEYYINRNCSLKFIIKKDQIGNISTNTDLLTFLIENGFNRYATLYTNISNIEEGKTILDKIQTYNGEIYKKYVRVSTSIPILCHLLLLYYSKNEIYKYITPRITYLQAPDISILNDSVPSFILEYGIKFSTTKNKFEWERTNVYPPYYHKSTDFFDKYLNNNSENITIEYIFNKFISKNGVYLLDGIKIVINNNNNTDEVLSMSDLGSESKNKLYMSNNFLKSIKLTYSNKDLSVSSISFSFIDELKDYDIILTKDTITFNNTKYNRCLQELISDEVDNDNFTANYIMNNYILVENNIDNKEATGNTKYTLSLEEKKETDYKISTFSGFTDLLNLYYSDNPDSGELKNNVDISNIIPNTNISVDKSITYDRSYIALDGNMVDSVSPIDITIEKDTSNSIYNDENQYLLYDVYRTKFFVNDVSDDMFYVFNNNYTDLFNTEYFDISESTPSIKTTTIINNTQKDDNIIYAIEYCEDYNTNLILISPCVGCYLIFIYGNIVILFVSKKENQQNEYIYTLKSIDKSIVLNDMTSSVENITDSLSVSKVYEDPGNSDDFSFSFMINNKILQNLIIDIKYNILALSNSINSINIYINLNSPDEVGLAVSNDESTTFPTLSDKTVIFYKGTSTDSHIVFQGITKNSFKSSILAQQKIKIFTREKSYKCDEENWYNNNYISSFLNIIYQPSIIFKIDDNNEFTIKTIENLCNIASNISKTKETDKKIEKDEYDNTILTYSLIHSDYIINNIMLTTKKDSNNIFTSFPLFKTNESSILYYSNIIRYPEYFTEYADGNNTTINNENKLIITNI